MSDRVSLDSPRASEPHPSAAPDPAPDGAPGRAPDRASAATSAATSAANVQPVLLSYEDFRFRPHHCFACGELSEVGLHLKLNLEPGKCWTELELPRRFEGWEGIIHGGIICTILDEVMAWSLVARDNWGVTARMSVDFRKPVAVGQPIRAEGWIIEDRRRIQVTAARLIDAVTGVELAAAQATYVAASETRKRELKEFYGVAEDGEGEPS
jgi:acyl-coenzyme A thioesterase PaaI-like protein